MEINFACDLIIVSMSVQFEKSKETDFVETENQDQKKVNLNDLVSRMNFEKKKERKNNIILSAAAISAVAVFGIILTL
tara:strand:- start:114 stop:347 length:234 start_codon:yes stop_codon:yes gene_type:complete